MRLGFYGGSFDPVHAGHVAAAEAVLAARGLDGVLFVPAGHAPHKREAPHAPFADRLEMVRIAIAGRPGLEACDREGRRAGPSYSIETLEELAAERPGAAWELLAGADMLADLPGWKRAGELVRRTTVVGFDRPGAAAGARDAFERAFGPGRCVWVDFEPLEVSSTEVRRRLARGLPVEGLLDPAVFTFICQKRLYGARKGG